MSTGQKAVQIARNRGFTPSTLARAIGVTVQTVQQWESGETNPSNKRLPRLANVLKVSPGAFFDESTHIDSIDARAVAEPCAEYTALTHDEKALVKTYRHLTGKEKLILKTIIDALAAKTK